MLVVIHLDRRVDADGDGDVLRCSAGPVDAQGRLLAGAEDALDAYDVEGFGAVEVEGLGVGAVGELEGDAERNP